MLVPGAGALARENASKPAARTQDFPWMSAATWREKHAAVVSRAAQGGADILLLGDSITEGWAATGLWEARFPDERIVHAGIGGDTTANLLWRIEDGALGVLRPRLVVLLIGVNNLGRNGDKPAAVVRGVQAITARLHARLPGAKILVVAILPADADPKSRLRRQIARTNQLLRRQVHDGHSVFVEDFGAALLEPDGTIAAATMADFLHPTPAGYERLGAALFVQAARLLGPR